MSVYLGIDPGSKGCLCFLNTDSRKMAFLPTPCLKVSAREVRQKIMGTHRTYGIIKAGIEDVHSVFGSSASSNFQFGWHVGGINMLLESTGIGFERIQPKVWQKGIGLVAQKPPRKPPELKKAIAALALRLYPDAPLLGPKGGLIDGRADALMIAHYLALQHGGIKRGIS